MPVNVELLRKTIEWADSEYEKSLRGEFSEWNQAMWITIPIMPLTPSQAATCGTTCCIAGKIALEEGWVPSISEFPHLGEVSNVYNYETGERKGSSVVAAEALGVDEADTVEMFDGANSIVSLWAHAHRLSNGEIEIPAHRML